MLEYEWRELETMCDRISHLRHHYSFALRSRNIGLIEGLKEDIANARWQREMLVHHISARLGSAAAEQQHPSDAVADRAPPDDEPTRSAEQAASAESAGNSAGTIGFSRR